MIPHPQPRLQLLEPTPDPVVLENSHSVYLSVSGMRCAHCATRVHDQLSSLQGVIWVEVFFWEQAVLVAFDPRKVQPAQLTIAVVGAAQDRSRYFGAEVKETRPARETLKVIGGQPQWCWPTPHWPDCPAAWH